MRLLSQAVRPLSAFATSHGGARRAAADAVTVRYPVQWLDTSKHFHFTTAILRWCDTAQGKSALLARTVSNTAALCLRRRVLALAGHQRRDNTSRFRHVGAVGLKGSDAHQHR